MDVKADLDKAGRFMTCARVSCSVILIMIDLIRPDIPYVIAEGMDLLTLQPSVTLKDKRTRVLLA